MNCINRILLFTCMATLIFGAQNSFAQTVFSGTLLKDKAKLSLIDENKITFSIKCSEKMMYSTLADLESGDEIVVAGEVVDHTLFVVSVLRVGIQKILGVWVGKDEFLKFDNFGNFRSFEPNFENNKLVGMLAQQFKYYLVPDSMGHFVISYTNSQSAQISAASVGLSNSKMILEVIDTDTGKVKERKRYDRLLNPLN